MVCPHYTALGGCDEAAFSAAIKAPLQICDSEVTAAFLLLATEDPTSDTTLIDLSDMMAWRNTIIDGNNPGGIYIYIYIPYPKGCHDVCVYWCVHVCVHLYILCHVWFAYHEMLTQNMSQVDRNVT